MKWLLPLRFVSSRTASKVSFFLINPFHKERVIDHAQVMLFFYSCLKHSPTVYNDNECMKWPLPLRFVSSRTASKVDHEPLLKSEIANLLKFDNSALIVIQKVLLVNSIDFEHIFFHQKEVYVSLY